MIVGTAATARDQRARALSLHCSVSEHLRGAAHSVKRDIMLLFKVYMQI